MIHTSPAISYLEPNDLKISRIPDKHVSVINTFVISDTLPQGEYFVSHFMGKTEALVKAGLLEGSYNEEQEAGERQLSDMVGNVLTQYFGRVEQNHNNEFVLPRIPTQGDVANIIQWYNQSALVTESSSSVSLCYELFSSDKEIEETLRNSGISLRKIYTLKEEGGTTEAASWKGTDIQLYQGRGARFDKGLEAIRSKGFERYLRSDEAFRLNMDILESKVEFPLQEVFDYTGYEWLSLAWEIKGQSLIAYVNPVGLQFQEYTDSVTKAIRYKYRTPHFGYKDKKSFSIEKMCSKGLEKRYSLSEFDNDFIEFHCGRTFVDLPQVIKDSAKVDLPPENFLVPVAHSPSIFIFGHVGCNGLERGVRKQK